MASARTLHVRCTTWEQVEVFHTRKLRRGKLLSMKVPFHCDRGAAVTLNLELPNRVVVAIEGTVLKSSPAEPDPKSAKPDVAKTWLEVELVGFNEEIIARLRKMAAGLDLEPEPVLELVPEPALELAPVVRARRPSTSQGVRSASQGVPESASQGVPESVSQGVFESVSQGVPQSASQGVPESVSQGVPESVSQGVPRSASQGVPRSASQGVPRSASQGGGQRATGKMPADERAMFQQLTAELRRLRSVAVHEVLGVPRDADAEAIRLGWMDLMRRYHPDLVARRNAPAISHLAEELAILANRAYDRLRVALVSEGRATSVGPALTPPPGWLVGFDDISSTGSILRAKLAQELQSGGNAPQVEPLLPQPPQAQGGEGGEAFELRARAMLGDGDADNAQEVLAAALCVYPRSRPLRSLYYVASAVSALAKGEVMLATSQLETAIAHHEDCSEAVAILELLRRPNTPVANEEMTRLFR